MTNNPQDRTGNLSYTGWSLHFIALGLFPLIIGLFWITVGVGAQLGFWSRRGGPDSLTAVASAVVGYIACVTLPIMYRRIASLETTIASLQNESKTTTP